MEIKEITALVPSLSSSYDFRLVLLSVAIAILGSHIALDIAGQVIIPKKLTPKFWLIGSAIALGITIWAMHFIAILAYQLPTNAITYDLRMLLISIVVAIVGAGIGLFIVTQAPLQWPRLVSGSFFVGLGIIGMHFTAMQAMLLAAEPKYNIQLMILAEIWTILLSLAALWLMFHSSANIVAKESIRKFISAIIAGAAIVGMHYIAMAAVKFYPSVEKLREASSDIDNYALAITIGVAAVIIMVLARLASDFGQSVSSKIARAEAYENFFNLAPDGCVTTSINGRIIKANKLFADYMNDAPEKLIGTSAWDTVYQEDLQNLKQNISRMIENKVKNSEQTEFRKVRKDGSFFWVDQRRRLVFDDNNNPIEMNIICTDLTPRKNMEEKLRKNATHDALTGLPNRVLFMERVKSALEQAKRHQDDFAVLFLDLDRFKVVNDSLGHLLGDKLLIEVATRLRSGPRSEDMVARLGGDEFTIFLQDIKDASDAIRVAERVLAELSKPFTLDGPEIFTSASIGIVLSTTGYDNPTDLLRDADIAMYQAKSEGGARYRIFNQEMHDNAVKLLQLETDLRTALEKNEFRLHYQPIVSLGTNSIAGFEALLRWQRSNDLWEPGKFIDQAEQAGLIGRIGEWVLNEACSQLRQWQRIPTASSLIMSVNISGKQFNQPHLSDQIQQILRDTGLEAASLRLEITEGTIKNDAAAEILQKIKNIGVQLSIDDFGTGYSSLKRLSDFPIDELKMDRCFVEQIEKSSTESYVVEAIVTLAHKLKLVVTAEGVEKPCQLALLRVLKCQYVQGYLFSKPLDSKKAEELLRQNPRWNTKGERIV